MEQEAIELVPAIISATSHSLPTSTLSRMEIRRRPPNPPVAVQKMRYQIRASDAEARHILEEIVWHKEVEIDQRREVLSLIELQKEVAKLPPPRNF